MIAKTIINVDLVQNGVTQVVYAKQYDQTARQIEIHFTVGGQVFEIPDGTAAVFRAAKPDHTGLFYDAEIVGNAVVVDLVQQALTVDGLVKAEINLFNGGQRLSTFNFLILVEKSPITDEEIISSDYFTALQGMISTIMESATLIKPKGFYPTLAALEAAVVNPAIGDLYGVGTAPDISFYFYNGSAWIQSEVVAGPEGPQGAPGVDGAPGPAGPQGPEGRGFAVLGYFATAAALEAAITDPEPGDAYGVGASEPYDIYIWDGVNDAWVNNGQLQGAKGDQGEPGEDGADGAPGPNLVNGSTATPFNGILKGNGTTVEQATPGTDYETPVSVVSDSVTTNITLDVGTWKGTDRIYTASATALTITNNSAITNYDLWLRFKAGAGFALTLPAGTKYIGTIPEYATGESYEISYKNGVAIIAQIGSGA